MKWSSSTTWKTSPKKRVKKLMKSDEIYVGERTKGFVTFDDSIQPIVYNVDYEYCTEVGEDWGDDVWEEHQTQVQL